MPRVLIVKTSSMGDIVHNLPVVADLRRALPTVTIDWVVEEAYVDLVRMTRGLDRVLPVALRRWRQAPHRRQALAERRDFIDRLRRERYDVVLDTQGLLKSALVARWARLAPHGARVGFALGLVRESVARLFYGRAYAVDPRLHAIERMRALAAAAFGYPLDGSPPRFELEPPPGRLDWLPADGSQGHVVLLHATARPEKAWPPERWATLAERLCLAGLVPVLPSGNAAEREVADALAGEATRRITSSAVRPLVAPPLALPEVAALLGSARAVVGVDTGLLHLAAALDVPTVGLFGATPRWRYAPYWSPQAINLGCVGDAGAQPGVGAVVDALGALGVLPAAAGSR